MKNIKNKTDHLIIRAFNKIGQDLANLLYEQEVMDKHNSNLQNETIESYYNFLSRELDSILAKSCKQLLSSIDLRYDLKYKVRQKDIFLNNVTKH